MARLCLLGRPGMESMIQSRWLWIQAQAQKHTINVYIIMFDMDYTTCNE